MDAPTLTFDPLEHVYRAGGRVVPSVTQILSLLVDWSGVPRDVLEAKRDLGTRVHEACQFHDEDDLDPDSIEADVEPYLAGYRRFLAETRAEVVHNERRVHSPLYGYAGTLDRVMRVHGTTWLVDLKTSIATPITTGPQTAAYQRALDDPRVTRRAALRLRPDGTYRFDPLDNPNDWSVFLSALTVRNYLEAHK